MSEYDKYRYFYLASKLSFIILMDTMMRAEFVHDILTFKVRRIVI